MEGISNITEGRDCPKYTCHFGKNHPYCMHKKSPLSSSGCDPQNCEWIKSLKKKVEELI
jgi:hypothetical protein